MNAQLILVNEQDEVIGAADKLSVHQQGLLHRAFSVLLYRKQAGKLELLLQQRQKTKYHSGGLWTNTCCSHPRPGEDTAVAAERRLFEETGIRTPLNYLGSFRYMAHFANGLIEHELDHVFVGEYQVLPVDFDREEIEQMRWVPLSELRQDLEKKPYLYTPWFERVLDFLDPA